MNLFFWVGFMLDVLESVGVYALLRVLGCIGRLAFGILLLCCFSSLSPFRGEVGQMSYYEMLSSHTYLNSYFQNFDTLSTYLPSSYQQPLAHPNHQLTPPSHSSPQQPSP